MMALLPIMMPISQLLRIDFIEHPQQEGFIEWMSPRYLPPKPLGFGRAATIIKKAKGGWQTCLIDDLYPAVATA